MPQTVEILIALNREYHTWHSPTLSRQMDLLVFGHSGAPVLVFPTSMGRFYQYEDFGMVQTLAHKIENGWIQLFCIDSIDEESWYNRGIWPGDRVLRHNAYEQYVIREVLPFIQGKNPTPFLVATGCSFGAYHCMNFSLKHPDLVDRAVAISGNYDIHHLLNGHYDESCYFNCPLDYLQNLSDPWYLSRYARKLEIIMTAGEWDICLDPTLRLSGIMKGRGIPHCCDIWGDHTVHDWPAWKEMVLKFL